MQMEPSVKSSLFALINNKVTRMAFELFPEIASVKTLKWPRGDSRGPFESLN